MRYELRKLLCRTETRVLLILTLIALGVLALRTDRADPAQASLTRELTAQYADMPYTEAETALKQAMTAPEVTADPARYNAMNELLLSAAQYKARDEEIAGYIAQWRAEAQHANGLRQRDLNHSIRAYNRAYAYPLCSRNRAGLGLMNLADAVYIYLFLLAMLAVGSALFAQEHETGMYQLLYAAKRGKPVLYRQKLATGMLLATLFGLLYQVLLFAMLWCKRGLSIHLLAAPLQTFPEFERCPFAITLAEYVLLRGTAFALGGMLTVALIALLSARLTRTAAVFGIAAGVCTALLLPTRTAQTTASAALMHRLGLFSIMQPERYLTGYETVNVCGFPLPQLMLSVLFTCTVTVTAAVIGRICYTGVKGCSAFCI